LHGKAGLALRTAEGLKLHLLVKQLEAFSKEFVASVSNSSRGSV
jgi:hypothetical protein